jgi:hypothetical protein
MLIVRFLDDLSIVGIFIWTTAIITVATEFGNWLGKREYSNCPETGKIYTGPAVGATMGLLAFMLAFSFGSATSRYEDRKQLVLDEANAIGTTYLRADVLDQHYRAQARCLLKDYVTHRLEQAQRAATSGIDVNEVLHSAEETLTQLWQLAINATEQKPTPHTALYIAATNEVIDLHQERVTAAFQHQMPDVFWYALYFLVVITTMIGGYDAGVSGANRSFKVNMPVAIAFSIVLTLVVELDRPKSSLVVTQQPLMDVRNSMTSAGENCP